MKINSTDFCISLCIMICFLIYFVGNENILIAKQSHELSMKRVELEYRMKADSAAHSWQREEKIQLQKTRISWKGHR